MTGQAPLFDTYQYVKRLTDSGVDIALAEAHAEALDRALASGVATKEDIALLRSDISALETKLTIRMGGGLIALGAFLTYIKFFAD